MGAIGEWADPERVDAWRRGAGQDVGCPCCGGFDYGEERVGGFAGAPGMVIREVTYRCARSGHVWTDIERYAFAGSEIEG